MAFSEKYGILLTIARNGKNRSAAALPAAFEKRSEGLRRGSLHTPRRAQDCADAQGSRLPDGFSASAPGRRCLFRRAVGGPVDSFQRPGIYETEMRRQNHADPAFCI